MQNSFLRILPRASSLLLALTAISAVLHSEAAAQDPEGNPLAVPSPRRLAPARLPGGGGAGPQAVNVVLPKAYATRWGELANAFPFGASQMRYQQVYLGSEAPQANAFRAVGFREDDRFAASGGTIRCVIKLGYTKFDHLTIGLNSNFDANFNGGNKATVFSGTVNLPKLRGGNRNLTNFAVKFPFTKPWVWVPAKGRNILMEVVNSHSTNRGFYDKCQQNTTLATTTRIWNTSATAANAARGIRNEGLVTEFVGLGGCAPARFVTYGAGCRGTAGVPLHGALGTPRLGGRFSLTLSQARAKARAVMLLGMSKTSWLGFRLPLDLTPLGANGCSVLAAGTVLTDVQVSASGTAAVPITLANNPQWCGVKFFTQYVVLDNFNRLGLVLSNGGESTIGS